MHSREQHEVPSYSVSAADVPHELARYHDAVRQARTDVGAIAEQLSDISRINRDLLDTHAMMLADPEVAEQVRATLEHERCNVEQAVSIVFDRLIAKLGNVDSDYLRDRAADLHDIRSRILTKLLPHSRMPAAAAEQSSILVAHALMPSDAIELANRGFIGLATDTGSKSSHTAIVARGLEIPAVLGLQTIAEAASDGDQIIVDGNQGVVVLQPSRSALRRYRTAREQWLQREHLLLTQRDEPAQTRDGRRVLLHANIEFPAEVESALAHGAEGVGLFRSEFLFLQPGGPPDEEAQYQAFRAVLEDMGERSVTIRTLDVGGEKVTPQLATPEESNPILGFRAIRYCHAHPELFKVHLRAMLRASVHGNLKIMFPMISSVEELDESLDTLHSVQHELSAAGVPHREVPVGIMIEVPSAAICADLLAPKVDFFSIGTNDLVQYTAAVDRGNERVAYLYRPLQPAVLRLLRGVIEIANEHSVTVSLCGELAGDPLAAPVLLGLGIDELSMGAVGIPMVKNVIRNIDAGDARELVARLLTMTHIAEIEDHVVAWTRERINDGD